MSAFFFNANWRIYVVRLVAFISLILVLVVGISLTSNTTLGNDEPRSNVGWLLLVVLILIHHVSTVTKWPWFYGFMDFFMLCFEIFGWYLFGLQNMMIDRYSSQMTVLLVVNTYIVIGALVVSWIFRFANLIASRAQSLLNPFSIFECCFLPNHRLDPYYILFGRSLWRSMFKGESGITRAIRGILAASFLTGIITFGIIAIIMEPIRETGLVPTKEYHTTNVLYDFNMAAPVWSIIAFVDARTSVPINTFKSSVNVTPLWDDSRQEKPECVHIDGYQFHEGLGNAADTFSDPNLLSITIFCPTRGPQLKDIPSMMSAPTSDTSPDLLLTINFTNLGPRFLSQQHSLVDARYSAVSILVGLTNNSADVFANSSPTPLMPGMSLLGSASRSFRRRFVDPRAAAWGLFTASRTFLVTDIYPTFPDPSPLIPRGPDIATLRIFGQSDFSEWTINQDYRQNSVWGGFAQVGGFWTFLNAVFVFLFGGSMLLVLLGIKPLSAFGGVVNKLHAERLQKMFEEEYPAVVLEQHAPKSKRGLLAFLRDNVIDMDPAPGESSIMLPGAHVGGLELEPPARECPQQVHLPDPNLTIHDNFATKRVQYPKDRLHVVDLEYGRGSRKSGI